MSPAQADFDYGSVLFDCAILLALLGAGIFVAFWLRRRIFGSADASVGGAGFTLGDLRALHRSGQMSTEEFDKARAAIVQAAKRSAQPDKPTPGRPAGTQGFSDEA